MNNFFLSSKNITDTESRLKEILNNHSEDYYNRQNIPSQIETAINENMLTTGIMTKFYPSINKSEIKLDTTGEKVICKNSLLFMGDLILLYTPSGDASYCERMKEPCVIPRGKLGCIVGHLNSNDDDEYLFLSYYSPYDMIGLNPSKQGNFKILAMGGVNEYSLRFGLDGLQVVNNGKIMKTELDSFGGDVTESYYTQDEIDDLIQNEVKGSYYTQEEVDNLINNLREELLNQINPDDSNNNENGETDLGE